MVKKWKKETGSLLLPEGSPAPHHIWLGELILISKLAA